MKKLVTLCLIGSALALSACANNSDSAYTGEHRGPYANERTAGASNEVVQTKGDAMFQGKQRK